MAIKVRVRHKKKGYRQLLTSPEVRADLVARSERIAEAADRNSGGGTHVTRIRASGVKRARAAVITGDYKAVRGEAADASLTRAVDAGR